MQKTVSFERKSADDSERMNNFSACKELTILSFLWEIDTNSDQTPQNAAYDQGLQCLLTDFII